MAFPLIVLITALFALVLNLILTSTILKLSHKFQWYDQKDHRKIHTEDTPRLGGVGFFLAFIVTSLLLPLINPEIGNNSGTEQIFTSANLLLFLGLFLVHILGLYDDFRNIRAIFKLIGQIIAGGMVALGGALMDGIYIPVLHFLIPLGPLSGAITIIWLISISNAVNLLDGLDGLAGGTALIAAAAIGVVHLIFANYLGALYSFILVGALVGFLVFNKPKAKIFMGDSGSLFLGFLLGALIFVGNTGSVRDGLQALNQFQAGFVLTITVLFVPIVDTISAILRRIRKGMPIHHPDKEHLHHKLLDFGFSSPKILAIIYPVNAFLALATIVWALIIRHSANYLLADIILVASMLVASMLFIILHYANEKRKQTS